MLFNILRTVFPYFSIFFLSSIAYSQDEEFVIDKMKMEVEYLSSDNLEGRATGTDSEQLAAQFIIGKFIEYGLIPKGDNGYYQCFEASVHDNPHVQNSRKKISGCNVVGYIDNDSKETIVIGAHYDHLGYGHFGSLSNGSYEIHNGADDNASGVSVLINLISAVQEIDDYNFLFIGFSGEEHGLLGSSYYVKNSTIDLKKVKYMLNFDMVGRLNQDNKLLVNGVGTSIAWEDLLNESNNFGFDLKFSSSGMGASDHNSFYLMNIPVLHFFTGQHKDYHKPSDDSDKINYKGMYLTFRYVKSIIDNSTYLKTMDFIETETDSLKVPRFKVTLGVMPDYLYDGEGMRIDGVSKNKTAHKFGVLKGDVVVKMGEVDVLDMMTYMQALSRFEKGDSTTLNILRLGEELQFMIVFQ